LAAAKTSAVSIVKAGMRVVGRSAGPVRAPLIDLTEDEEATLVELVARAMTAMKAYGQPPIPAQEEA
jgi:5-dehydro-4-deoxyglucarate dehydratase